MKTLLSSVAALGLLAGAAQAEPLKIGVMATLEGPYTVLGEDGMRGLTTAMAKWGDTVGGRDIELIVAATDASPESAIRAARKLVEQDGVEIVIGPLSGSEGIAMRDFSKDHTGVTFINGSSGAQETTYVDPSDNFFRYNMEGAQWSMGLGEYIYNEKGYETIATIGEDYSFIYTQVFGLVVDFCQAGGEVTDRFWVPLGTKDFASIIAALPDDVDAIYLGLGGADAVNFLNQYQQAGGDADLIGGTIMVDGTVLSAEGDAKEALIGVPAAGPQADTSDAPEWLAFVGAYLEANADDPKVFPIPSLVATSYYNATDAAMTCLDSVGGDLSDGQTAYRECLSNLTLEAPNGTITLDGNRQAIGTNFVNEVVQLEDGTLATQMVYKVEGVTQTLGLDPEVFAAIGAPSRDVPACQSSY